MIDSYWALTCCYCCCAWHVNWIFHWQGWKGYCENLFVFVTIIVALISAKMPTARSEILFPFVSLSSAHTVFDNLDFHGITNLVEHPAQMAPPGIESVGHSFPELVALRTWFDFSCPSWVVCLSQYLSLQAGLWARNLSNKRKRWK